MSESTQRRRGSKPGERRGGRRPMPEETRPVRYGFRLPPSVVAWLKADPGNLKTAKRMLEDLADSGAE